MDHRALIVLLSLCSSAMPGEVRLVGGGGHCSGRLEVREHQGNWTPVSHKQFSDLSSAAAVCTQLDCGSVVSLRKTQVSSVRSTVDPLLNFFEHFNLQQEASSVSLEVTCSESVRLVNGTTLCSGRVEVKSNQLWSSVCEDDFEQLDAEVVCRELGCGAPSVLQGALYGDVDAPVWTKEFQCAGNESLLLDCESSTPKTCSSGRAVGLTCSDPDAVRLVGGASRCAGTLELKHHGEWKALSDADSVWYLKVTALICRWLDCGSSVSTRTMEDSFLRPVWWINSSCVQSKYSLKECVTTKDKQSRYSLEITCSESVRLVNGTTLCSGRVEVKSNQLWSSVCEDDFEQLDAEVVCRELGCGAPSVLQGALYGDVDAPVSTKEFQCAGNESLLLDCGTSDSAANTCSAVGLTCSDPNNVRLVGEASRCAGALEMKHRGEWRPVVDWDSEWDRTSAAAVCRQLECGSAVSTDSTEEDSDRLVWWVEASCVQSTSALLDCVVMTDVTETYAGLEVICSDLLARPNISLSPSADGVSEDEQGGFRVLMGSGFTITCSVKPQYHGGSFQLIFTASDTTHNYTTPAVDHSAHFLFSAASRGHRGRYTCVYHVYVFSHNFSSEGRPLRLTVSVKQTDVIIRHVVLLLGMMLLITTLCFSIAKARSRSQNLG